MVRVEPRAESVGVVAVDLDRDSLLRIGEVVPHLSAGEQHPVLLTGRRKASVDESAKGASFEIAVSG